jgi:hypothetical protein
MVRVTRKGGRVVVIAYGPPSKYEALQWFIDGLRAVNPAFEGMPSNPPPLEFQVSDPDVLRGRLLDAGLRDVTVDTSHAETIEVRSGRQLWDWCLGGNPIPGMLVAELSEDQRAAMRARFDQKIQGRSNGKGSVPLTAPLNIGVGTK